jgi:hypothetical protein
MKDKEAYRDTVLEESMVIPMDRMNFSFKEEARWLRI